MPQAPVDRTAALVTIATAARLWLGSWLHATYLRAPNDDTLYLTRALFLREGHWLGIDYTPFTLAKMPGYPLFLAATESLGLRLILVQQCVYLLACALFATALSPLLPTRGHRAALFLVLAYNPMSFSSEIATRVVREGIYPALTLTVLGCAVGLAARAHARWRARAPWTGGLALATAAFWLTREESPWILPTLATIVLGTFIHGRAAARPPRSRLLELVVAPALITAAALGAVLRVNYAAYGVAATTEFSTPALQRLTRAIYRVRGERAARYRLLPRDARARIYAISPNFAELRPALEGPVTEPYIRFGPCVSLGICDDHAGSWILHALRAATADRGYYQHGGPTVARFYDAISDDIERACRGSALRCDPPGFSILPPWRPTYTSAIPAAGWRGIRALVSLSDFHPGSDRRRIAPGTPILYGPIGESPERVEARWQRWVMRAIWQVYRVLLPTLLVIGAGAAGWRVARDPRAAGSLLAWVAAALAVAIGTRLAMLVAIDVSTVPAVTPLYLAPLYPLVIALACLGATGRTNFYAPPRAQRGAMPPIGEQGSLGGRAREALLKIAYSSPLTAITSARVDPRSR